jgi:hypothetical protein
MPQDELFPFPEYEDNVNVILDYYLEMRAGVLKELVRLMGLPQVPTVTEQIRQQQIVLQNITDLYNTFKSQVIVQTVPMVITQAYLSGIAMTRLELGMQGTKESINTQSVEFQTTHQYRIHKLVTDTQRDLLKATDNTSERVKTLVRQVVDKAIREKAIKNYGNLEYERQIKQELNRRILEEKLRESEIAIIDKANRRWNHGTYIKLLSKTKLMIAHVEAIKQEGANMGIDLGIINTHPLTTDACTKYQGMIVSLNGQTPGYVSIDTLRASGEIFHPNCRHYVRPVRSLSLVPPSQLAVHEKQMAAYKKAQAI